MFSKSATDGAGPPAVDSGSLAVSMTVWSASSCFLVSLAAIGILYWALALHLNRTEDERLMSQVRELRALAPSQLAGLGVGYRGVEVRIIDASGSVVTANPRIDALLPVSVFPDPPPESAEPRRSTLISSRGNLWRVASVRSAGGMVIQAALNASEQQQVLAEYRSRIWLALAWVLAGSVLAGYVVGRRAVAPVETLTRTALRIHTTSAYERLPVAGLPMEVAALAERFNELLDRFEASITRLSRFASEIAHELRTPVNNLRGEAEVALGKARSEEEYREVLSSCLEECERLSGAIDSLLFLARMETPGVELTCTTIDLAKELAAVREYYEAAAEEAGVLLDSTANGQPVIGADRNLFQRAVGNLMDNAIAYTPKGGRVTLTAAETGDSVRVRVADTGRGIPPRDLGHIFERFYRGDLAQAVRPGGSGLGLAIVKTIMTLHGGTVEVSSEVGRGTQIDLHFPLIEARPAG